MSEEKQQQQPKATEGEVFTLKIVSGVYVALGLACLICGIVTLVYAADDFQFPVYMGWGIVVGCMALAVATLGLVSFMRYDFENQAATRCTVFAFYGCAVCCISMSSMHLSWSIIGLTRCADNQYSFCTDGNRDRFLVVEVFNIVFAAMLGLMSFGTMLYLVTGRRLGRLTGTCGYCCCYSSTTRPIN